MWTRTFILITLLLSSAGLSSAATGEGPLVIKNGHPLFVALSGPPLSTAEPESSLTMHISYSSTFLVETSKEWDFGIDLETTILDLQLKRLVRTGTEIGIDLPLIRYGSGFLDGPLYEYHRLIGMDNAYGRNKRPKNVFSLSMNRNGKEIVHGIPNQSALGDITVEIKQSVYHGEPATVGVQAFLTLPAGDAKLAYGSGRTNGGGALLMNIYFPWDLVLYTNAGAVFMDKLEGLQDVPLRNYVYGGAGLEWLYSRKIAYNLQMTVQGSPYPITGDLSMDNPAVIGCIGGRYRMDGRSSIGLALTEDLNSSAAPDIMMSIDYRQIF